MPDIFTKNRRSLVAAVLLVAGVTGTVVDPDGPVGIALFGVAVAAVAYLLARPARRIVRRLAATSRPSTTRTVHGVVRGRTVAVVAIAMAVLFTLWLATDLARPLVYAFWWSFCLLAAWLVAVTVLTARRSLQAAH